MAAEERGYTQKRLGVIQTTLRSFVSFRGHKHLRVLPRPANKTTVLLLARNQIIARLVDDTEETAPVTL